MTWEESGGEGGLCRDGVRKDKAQLEPNLSRDTQNNSKGFYRSVRQKARAAKPLSRILEKSWQPGEVPGD